MRRRRAAITACFVFTVILLIGLWQTESGGSSQGTTSVQSNTASRITWSSSCQEHTSSGKLRFQSYLRETSESIERLKRKGFPVSDPLLSPGNRTDFFDSPEYRKFLTEEANLSRDEDRRIIAISELGFLPYSPEIEVALDGLLGDEQAEVRLEAVYALSRFANRETVQELLQRTLDDSDEDVRSVAGDILSEATRTASVP